MQVATQLRDVPGGLHVVLRDFDLPVLVDQEGTSDYAGYSSINTYMG